MNALEWIAEHGRYLRTISPSRLRRELNRQKGECTWCGEQVGTRRQTWCSNECVNAWRERCDANWITYQLQLRDQGICSRCGLDTLDLYRRLDERRRQYMGGRHHFDRLKALQRICFERLGFSLRVFQMDRRCPFDADHIVPVIEGGGCCGLENYRTLCIPCHKQETADLAARRARERRDSERTLLPAPSPEPLAPATGGRP